MENNQRHTKKFYVVPRRPQCVIQQVSPWLALNSQFINFLFQQPSMKMGVWSRRIRSILSTLYEKKTDYYMTAKSGRTSSFTQNEEQKCLKIKSELNRTSRVGSPCFAAMWSGSLLMGLGLALSLRSLDLEGTWWVSNRAAPLAGLHADQVCGPE